MQSLVCGLSYLAELLHRFGEVIDVWRYGPNPSGSWSAVRGVQVRRGLLVGFKLAVIWLAQTTPPSLTAMTRPYFFASP